MQRAHHIEGLPPTAITHHALSVTYHYLGDHGAALIHARQAAEGDRGNKEYAWNLELVTRQNTVAKLGEEALRTITTATSLKMPQPTQVYTYCSRYLEIRLEMFY